MFSGRKNAVVLATLALAFVFGSLACFLAHGLPGTALAAPQARKPLNVDPPLVTTDKTVKYDYDIVYVRVPRKQKGLSIWAEVGHPHRMDPGGDLMMLHPDGSEEFLVAGGPDGSVADPFVSFDGQWVYYAHFKGLNQANRDHPSPLGADIYKIHVKTRKITRLTHQVFTPNTGAADWASGYQSRNLGKTYLRYGVFNSGPCPLPGGKVVFTSNRNVQRPPTPHTAGSQALQLFVMDDDGSNVEQIGYLNLGAALHPVILKDGRVMFSSFEHQGMRGDLNWGLWGIHPDGTNWEPIISAYRGNTLHFQTQISDGRIVAAEYYNGAAFGFGTYYILPPRPPTGIPAFGPGDYADPRNPPMRSLPWLPGVSGGMSIPFQPYGMDILTRFCSGFDALAPGNVPGKKDAPRLGKVTHPSGAPDNHLLTVWSPGAVHISVQDLDAGIYLIKSGKPIDEPGQMLKIKNDPKYQEQWPRALVPYKRIYGIAEPKKLPALKNDGKLSPHLPEGTPFGLVGTSSLYKRESYPRGRVRNGVTASWPGGGDPYQGLAGQGQWNWIRQGADAGKYSNSDIHAIRILITEPTTDRDSGYRPGRLFYNHAKSERLRILGEIPVRKFGKDGKQPLDPDDNPDTSFLAKIPGDAAWTFQTLDKDGMVLNMSQTWHQLRPGEIRNDCGGCHAHSQQPTPFAKTAAARKDYVPFDLTKETPLLTTKKNDQSGKKWDKDDTTGLRYVKGVKHVEYFRDVRPILRRSCVACHTKTADKPAGNLVLDDDTKMPGMRMQGMVPGTYYRLAMDWVNVKFGHKPPSGRILNPMAASRYVHRLQARRSLLIWKVFGKRLDGFKNEDFITEAIPGNPDSLHHKGKPVPSNPANRHRATVGYTGGIMPPPEAVKAGKVKPLSDEDRLTLVRWVDLGCPIDLDYDPRNPERRGYGWMADDSRPTLTLTWPRAGKNAGMDRILVGMHDYDTGLDLKSFRVSADFRVDGLAAGQNLAARFKRAGDGIWELKLNRPITSLRKGKLFVSVKDRQGNISRIDRTFSVEE
jgi:hypothetical protein